jgi:hypothetical protein
MAAGLLFAFPIVLLAPTHAHAEKVEQPKLVWEKVFESDILAFGVDQDCLRQTRSTSCLKWVLFEDGKLYFFDGSGELTPDPVQGNVDTKMISPNGKYLFALRSPEGPQQEEGLLHYTLYDWDGHTIWETEQSGVSPQVSDAGSAVFHLVLNEGDIAGMTFYDREGIRKNTVRFPSAQWSVTANWVMSNNYFAAAGNLHGKGQEVCLFDIEGNVVWTQRLAGLGLGVSDGGDVIVWHHASEEPGATLFVYDEAGEPKDKVPFYATRWFAPIGTDGNLALVSTRAPFEKPSRFLCYDFERMKVRFIVKAEDDIVFGDADADTEAGLVALAVFPRTGQGPDSVRIYDLDGVYQTEVGLEGHQPSPDLWFRLADHTLLLTEKNRVRVYAFEGGE